ncbi:MAG: carboxypeptidase-like regulatory domain-containing protein [Pyrinomonadaceae bacterium]
MRKFVLLILLLAVSVSVALAQNNGGVKGKIRNANGDGIGGATITARQDGKDVKSTNSDGKGNFELAGLKSGIYNLVIDKKGYSAGLLSNVEIKDGKIRDLSERLVLTVDQGTQVIIKGSVFDPDGRSVGGAKIEIEKVSSDGSTKKVGSGNASYSGEFTFRFPEGAAKFRITASAKGAKESKEVEVDSAAIYRLAITLKTDKN